MKFNNQYAVSEYGLLVCQKQTIMSEPAESSRLRWSLCFRQWLSATCNNQVICDSLLYKHALAIGKHCNCI